MPLFKFYFLEDSEDISTSISLFIDHARLPPPRQFLVLTSITARQAEPSVDGTRGVPPEGQCN